MPAHVHEEPTTCHNHHGSGGWVQKGADVLRESRWPRQRLLDLGALSPAPRSSCKRRSKWNNGKASVQIVSSSSERTEPWARPMT
eukprot:6207134-Pleurochrysis_carterae.AAC.1